MIHLRYPLLADGETPWFIGGGSDIANVEENQQHRVTAAEEMVTMAIDAEAVPFEFLGTEINEILPYEAGTVRINRCLD